MSSAIRLLPFSVNDGPHNMAADEVMLEAAQAGQASIRFYHWDPATLSLGYFQRHQDRLVDSRLMRLPWIRRATGGGAIIHDGDLTYAVALPPSVRKKHSPAEWHCRIHRALAGFLRDHQVAAEVVAGERRPHSELDFLCFAVPQPGDVVLGQQKIIGGAQRLRAGALLQHGSIQLDLSYAETENLGKELAAALGWQALSDTWTAGELVRVDQLAAEKYGQDWWNCKR